MTERAGGSGQATIRYTVLIGVAAVAVFGLAAVVGFQIATSNRVIPGVTVLGVPAGGLTVEEAQARLGPRAAAILDQPVQLHAGDRSWTTSARELGVPLDPVELAKSAYAIGRQGSPFAVLGTQLDTLQFGADVPVAEYADGSRVDRLVTQIAADIYAPPRNAELALGDDATITYTTSQAGLELDQSAARAQVAAALEAGVPEVSLATRPLAPRVVTDQVSGAHDQLMRIFDGQPIQLTAADHHYELQTNDLLGIVALNEADGSTGASVSIKDDAVQALVDRISGEVDQSPVDARFAYEGASQLRLLRASQDGRGLDKHAASETLSSQILAGEHTIALPVTVVHAAVSSDDGGASLGIRDLIDESTTAFAGSIPEKAHNIQLAAARLNGVVVPPGGTFSFNKEVGPTTIEAGFQWGFGLTGGQGGVHTVPSVAGGICQVATTLFQPVFWGGYQLEERYWHLYWIPAYTSRGIVGLDATVDSDAGLDLKWINPTNDYVLIQASTDAEHVTFRLYGKKPDWTVQVEPPVISNRVTPDPTPDVQQEPLMHWGRVIPVETARDGFQVVLTRHVVPNDGSKSRDLTLKSIYQPGHNVTLVGTGGAPDGASVTAAVDIVRASMQPATASAPRAAQANAAPTAATAPAPSTISTPNGPRTLAQIRDELRNAGWGGGSDQDAVATYNHVAGAAKANHSDGTPGN